MKTVESAAEVKDTLHNKYMENRYIEVFQVGGAVCGCWGGASKRRDVGVVGTRVLLSWQLGVVGVLSWNWVWWV